MTKKLLLALVCLTAVHFSASAKVELPALVGDGMVLQQQRDVSLWGKARPSAKVTVSTSWDGKNYSVTSAGDGAWEVKVKTPVAGGPYSITISDGERLTLNNILIGEVWVCSGQSNMEMPMAGFNREPVNGGPENIMKASQNKGMRFFTVERKTSKEPVEEVAGQWLEATPEAVARFSATGFYFGKNLYDVLDVPVGLICAAWGGTRIEAWMSVDAAKRIDENILSSDKDQSAPNHTAVLYNSMLEPVSKFTAKGFIWYQGEGNIYNYQLYAANMVEMISLWCSIWDDETMPFYYVQLAPHNYGNPREIGMPRVIQQQEMVLDRMQNVGMASTSDIGESVSIHPSQKDQVGFRLALLALGKTYGIKGIEYQSPRMKEVRYDQSFAYVKFNSPSALTTKFQPLLGFEIAGADKKFYPAQARIVGNDEVRISSGMVAEPVAVRYAFRNYSDATLYSTSMLPAIPFRTDNWDDAW